MEELPSPVTGRALQQEWKDVLLTTWQSLLKKVGNVGRLLEELHKARILTKGSYGRLLATMPTGRQGTSPLWCNALLAAIPPDRRGFEGLKRALHSLREIEALHFLFSQWAYETVCLTPPVSPASTPQETPERPYLRLEDVLSSPSPGRQRGQRPTSVCTSLPTTPVHNRTSCMKLSQSWHEVNLREQPGYVAMAMSTKEPKRRSLPRKLQHRALHRKDTPPGLDYWSLYKLTTHVEKHPFSLSEYQLKGLISRLRLYPMDFFPTSKRLPEIFLSVLEQWKEANLEMVKPTDLLDALKDVPLEELSAVYQKHVNAAWVEQWNDRDSSSFMPTKKDRSKSDTGPSQFMPWPSKHYARTDVLTMELKTCPRPRPRHQNSVDSGTFSICSSASDDNQTVQAPR